jgi:hypothetical protein
MLRALPLLLLVACTSSPSPPAPSDAGLPDGIALREWAWHPIEGSRCGAGATAGFALNPAGDDELLLFLQGGGACWNQGSCVPSLLSYGPVCYYNPNLCLADVSGGTQPLAVHVTERDPYPADGGGAIPGELATLTASRAFDRDAPGNPFARASQVFVPYCTGDLHAGAREATYRYQYGVFDQPSTFKMHFAGATNIDAYLARLVEWFPRARKIWLTGVSAGGYGATLNYDRVARAFPGAEVHLLADSSPMVETFHFAEWRDAWGMQLPEGCSGCADGGFPAVGSHLAESYPARRLGLLSSTHDRVIAYYFFGGQGPDPALNPPVGPFNLALEALQRRYDASAHTRFFVTPGEGHVLWPAYGTRQADGGYSAPLSSRDGGTDLRRWIDAWATGGAEWESVR